MRLSCPSCGAVYEVPDDAIPAGGRDVQCTNCGHTWFHGDAEDDSPAVAPAVVAAPEPATAFDDGPGSGTEEAPLRRAPVDPELRQVLREEAEREIEARREEERRRPPVSDPQPQPQPRTGGAPRIDPPPAARAGLSPATRRAEPPPRRRRRGGGGGFLAGFVLTLLVAGALAAAYVYDEEVVEASPALAEPMAGYVGTVDEARVAVNGATRSLVDRIEALLPESAEG